MSAAPMSTSEASGSHGPDHVAIIMDGNGRWAKARGLPREAGHERGVEALRRTIEAAGNLGVQRLTVFSFSTENWRRPVSEVTALFGLLRAYVKRDLARLKREGVQVRVIGNRAGLPPDIAELVKRAEEETAHNEHFFLTIAFNYGGREEIVRAVSSLAEDVAAGRIEASSIDEKAIESRLDTSGWPDPDLIIRTSGEYRISNFLLWQIAYSEMIFVDVLWPDFTIEHLKSALETYSARERRFGAVASGTA
ncbi:MAG: isoprenyl transferase [Pseudomonadota bacterium]